MCGARRVLQAFVGKRPPDDFPAVFVWGLVKYYRLFRRRCFSLIGISLRQARFDPTLGSLCMDMTGVYFDLSLGELPAVCRVSLVHNAYVMLNMDMYM